MANSAIVSMEVMEVFMPSNEAFVVEAIVLPASTPVEVGDATFPSMGEPSVSASSLHAKVATAMSLSMVD